MRGLNLFSSPARDCKTIAGVKLVVGATIQSSAINATGYWAPADTDTHSGASSHLPENGFTVAYAVHIEIVPTQVKYLVRNGVFDTKRGRSKR
jgi:hypothetical protein